MRLNNLVANAYLRVRLTRILGNYMKEIMEYHVLEILLR